jgi:hypothetical protein
MLCICGNMIPEERREALPNAKTCYQCAQKDNKSGMTGFMVFDHKTAPTLVIIPNSDTETLRRAKRANSRSR